MNMLQQNPIVIETIRQPPVTPEISYGSVLLSAVGVVGILLLAGVVVGLIVGAVIVWRKRQHEATDPVGTSHTTLHLTS